MRGLRAIGDLPQLSEFISGGGALGFPEDFGELCVRPDLRLLRTPSRRASIKADSVVAFRNKDLLAMAAHPAAGVVPTEYHQFQRLHRNQIFTTDPPVHTGMRKVIAPSLAPKQIPRLAEIARGVASGLIKELSGQGEIDFSAEFSTPFATRFWGVLFEMTGEEVESLIELMQAINQRSLIGPALEDTVVEGILDRYLEVLDQAIERALQRGGNEMLEAMAGAFQAARCGAKPARVGEMIAANMIEGFHTIATVGAHVLFQLLSSPKTLAAVRAEPRLIPNAVSEGLRLWTPVVLLERFALRDFEFAGVLIPQDTMIAMLWGAGNRDPEVYEQPNEYDIFRKPRTETTFGGGIHICPGRYVARMLAQVMIEAVLAPQIRIDLSGKRPTWHAGASASAAGRQLIGMRVILERC